MEAGLLAARGLGRDLGVEAFVPLRMVRTGIAFEDEARRPITLADGSIHHREETLLRPGDAWLALHGARLSGAWTLAGRLGVSLPLGRTEQNPFALGRAGLAHQHLQFGTGTWNPVVGLGAGRAVGRLKLSLTTLSQFVLAENRHGYRAGDRHSASLLAHRPLSGGWHALAGLDLSREQSETWDGRREEEGNLGRTDLLVSLGIARGAGRAGSVQVTLKLPVVTRAAGAQLAYPLLVSIGWSRGR